MKQNWLKEHFKYSKGFLIVKKKHSPMSNLKIGQKIGSFDNGYLKVNLLSKIYKVHHLVWLYFKGSFPAKGFMIDHRNMVRSDNRIRNLRLATMSENQCNRKPIKKYKGVNRNSQSKNFSANISKDNKRFHLGSFKTQELAAKAYNKAAKKLHGKFAYLNKV